MARWSTVLSGVFLALPMVLSLGKLLLLATSENGKNGELNEAEQWLVEIGLEQYRQLFRENGKSHVSLHVSFFGLFLLTYIFLQFTINFAKRQTMTIH